MSMKTSNLADKKYKILPKTAKLHLQIPDECVIIIKHSRWSVRLKLFVQTEKSSVSTRNFFNFCQKKQNTRLSCYENNGNLKRQGSMKNMVCAEEINILEAAKFVVQLYYRAEQKYHCTLTKVEKILAIADLIVMRDGTELFSDKIVSHDCGVGFPILSNFLYSNIVSGEDEQSQPITCALDENIDIPKMYQISDDFPKYVKDILTNVFREFGDYTAKDLGLSFNVFKETLLSSEVIDNEKVIDSKKVQEHFKNKNDLFLSKSSVYKFVYTYPMVNYGS